MDKGSAPPMFLERRSYRRRRIMDAQRLLPVLGLILWMVPILWRAAPEPEVTGVRMSDAIFYVFGVWIMLIGLAGWMWWWLARAGPVDDAR